MKKAMRKRRIKMDEKALVIRPAEAGEEEDILFFIRKLAEYEHLEADVTATAELLHEWIFIKNRAEVLFAEVEGKKAGFALFFHNFSTFLGKAGIYLEDLFVLPEYRGMGVGGAMISALAQIACERGCGRLEWSCLDWNAPSIGFYLSLGAKPMDGWTTYRVCGDTLKQLAQR